ncbi:MAG: YraN family protein [Pseudomonadota bacterium]
MVLWSALNKQLPLRKSNTAKLNFGAARFSKGKLAEVIARVYLRQHGYRCVAANFRNRAGEIDLILEHPAHRAIVFVEVKYRSHAGFGGASYAITQKQLRRIQNSAGQFMARHPRLQDHAVRFDAILFHGSLWQLEWIQGL